LIQKGPQQIAKFVALCQNPKVKEYLNHYKKVSKQNMLDNALDALEYFI